ncbi:hypothetical protein [Methanobrevibacter sp. UBA337]
MDILTLLSSIETSQLSWSFWSSEIISHMLFGIEVINDPPDFRIFVV